MLVSLSGYRRTLCRSSVAIQCTPRSCVQWDRSIGGHVYTHYFTQEYQYFKAGAIHLPTRNSINTPLTSLTGFNSSNFLRTGCQYGELVNHQIRNEQAAHSLSWLLGYQNITYGGQVTGNQNTNDKVKITAVGNNRRIEATFDKVISAIPLQH
jgi:hypothetical protein